MENPGPSKSLGFFIVIGSLTYWFPWRGVRAVYGAGLENQWTSGSRGFESHPLLHKISSKVRVTSYGNYPFVGSTPTPPTN